MTWYYVKDGEAAGPISDEELVSKLRIGKILPTTLVWRSGMPEWRAAAKVAAEITVAPPAQAAPYPGPVIDINAPPELAPTTPPVLPTFFCTSCGNVIPADQLVHIGGRAVCAACKPVYVQQVREGLPAPLKVPVIGDAANAFAGPDSDLADPAMRLVGYILDVVFLSVPGMLGYFLIMALGLGAAIGTGGGDAGVAAFMIGVLVYFGLLFAGVFAYWTVFIARRGATPGMKIMKLKMVRGDRGPIGFGRALGRFAVFFLLNMFSMSLVNITAFFDREKRTIVDMICDTRVVRN